MFGSGLAQANPVSPPESASRRYVVQQFSRKEVTFSSSGKKYTFKIASTLSHAQLRTKRGLINCYFIFIRYVLVEGVVVRSVRLLLERP